MAVKDRPLFRRILEFDDLMRRRRLVNAASLSTRWKTSTKTAQRFVAFMRDEMDAPIVFDRKRGSFRYSDPLWHLPWIPVEGPGLFAIGVASKVLQLYEGTPVAEGLREAFQRISEMMPPEIRVSPGAFVEQLYIHPQPIRLVDPAVWTAVATAIREKAVLKVRYQKPTGETSVRQLAPYGLALAAGDWLVAAQDRQDDPGTVKTFYVARIRNAEVGSEVFSVPRDFDLKTHFGEAIGIFPQGSVSRDAWRRGAARLALSAGAPLVPVRILGTDAALVRGRIGFPRITVLIGEPVAVERQEPTAEVATALTARLRGAVEALGT